VDLSVRFPVAGVALLLAAILDVGPDGVARVDARVAPIASEISCVEGLTERSVRPVVLDVVPPDGYLLRALVLRLARAIEGRVGCRRNDERRAGHEATDEDGPIPSLPPHGPPVSGSRSRGRPRG